MKKRLKERTRNWKFPPFPYGLTVVVSNDINASIQKRAGSYGLNIPNDPNMTACVFGAENAPKAVMFLPHDSTVTTITHESTHVIWFMLHFVGVKLDNETLAYYIGWLSGEVGRFVYGSKDKTKKQSKGRVRGKLTKMIAKLSNTP